MVTVAVIADRREHRRSDPEAGEPGRDVAREPADRPDEGFRGRERGPRSGRGEVHPDPADDERLDHDSPPRVTPGA